MMDIHDIARRVLMEFASAEEKYAPVEYLESSGTQWIDTGFKLTEESKVETIVSDVSITASEEQMIFGAKSSDNVAGFWFEFYKYPSGCACASDNGSYKVIHPASSQSYHIVQSVEDGSVVNGVQQATFSTAQFTTDACTIFTYSRLAYKAKCKMGFFRIWNGGTLVRDLRPMLRLRDSKPGMYDMVSKKFYINNGTGEFAYGDFVLPEGYQRVEYVESNGTQWIDTGVYVNQDTDVEIDYCNVRVSNAYSVFGCNPLIVFTAPNTLAFMVRYNSATYSFSGSQLERAKRRVNGGVVMLDGEIVHTFAKSTFSANYTALLFARRVNSSGGIEEKAASRVWSCKIDKARTFVPAVRLSDGKPGLYDACQSKCPLTNTPFYINSGTGADFTYPALSAKDYVQDGLVAMWDGIENAGFGVHDGSATVWKDLSGHSHDLASENFVWTNDALDDTDSITPIALSDLACTTGITMEAAICCPNYRNNAYIFDFQDHASKGCSLFTTSLSEPYGIRCSLRNGNTVAYTGIHACDDAYKISASMNWAGNQAETRYFGVLANPVVNMVYIAPPHYYLLGAQNGPYNNFRGYVYSMRVYNRALTPEEIAHNYAIDRLRFNLA